nr:NB-ARC domains-containing protein [Tanacetum cinerariifolium]
MSSDVNSIPEWFTNRCRENHVKVELPSADWCYDKNFRGFGTYVVFKCKKPFNTFNGYSEKNFDGASLKGPGSKDVEVKECGARLICDEDIQHGGMLCVNGTLWSW